MSYVREPWGMDEAPTEAACFKPSRAREGRPAKRYDPKKLISKGGVHNFKRGSGRSCVRCSSHT